MSRIISTAVKVTLAAAVAVGSTALVAAPAHAKSGDQVEARGTCTGGATWKLKAKHDNSAVKYEFEVDTNKVGQVWTVWVSDNGTNVFSGQKTTLAPSGSFSVEKTTADRAGSDLIKAKAVRGTAVCSGSVTV